MGALLAASLAQIRHTLRSMITRLSASAHGEQDGAVCCGGTQRRPGSEEAEAGGRRAEGRSDQQPSGVQSPSPADEGKLPSPFISIIHSLQHAYTCFATCLLLYLYHAQRPARLHPSCWVCLHW